MQIANGRCPENNGEIYNACTVYKQTTHYRGGGYTYSWRQVPIIYVSLQIEVKHSV